MMVSDPGALDRPGENEAVEYPLKRTATVLNDRLGLYLSEDQQRGFAAGLLIGTAVGAAMLAWSLTSMLLRRR